MEEFLDHWLWREEYWLPPGVTWRDMVGTGDTRYPLPRDLLFSLSLSLIFIGVRYIFERWVALPLSRQLGVKDRIRIEVPKNVRLEEYYKKRSRCPSEGEVLLLSKQSELSVKQIERWFRRRRNQDRPSNSRKFCEACWRFTFYSAAFLAGLMVLIDKPWFWDQSECWAGYPKQPLQMSLYWYYMIELAFYWSLLLRVSFDVKRKSSVCVQDFKEQIIHHVATIVLIGFSYCSNYIRVGTLVMLVHDASDYLLESAKMFNYAGWKRTCDTLFVIFSAVFLFTRLVVFPIKIIHTTLYLSMEVFEPFFGYYFFNVLLLVLQVLHIFWASLILRMVWKFVFEGKVDQDERSDVEETDFAEDEEEKKPWDARNRALDSKLVSLANNNCVLNNLTSQRNNTLSTLPKAR
ncbi:ceramide synthase 2-like isoform X1 [Polypterus senegalus]|uniref:ceramide synthase 2-like isoform X1 n=1 Tax=Polypterus senegalus TaxID=55291 RepID=UPI001965F285|nr:ceramide synthase 2-like isoform X1 [Polypterus senegalus]XP_039622710.1 ceramide synthase 2-like isoform X1 [Polypterus senegalus]XP_039622711.1 ceramide synthase 2-like isoform X1 [Polypterus senegalus]XP_039622712.1 ceramide synthase 2-like isoform X1 [Polypterus senegalus]